VASIEDEDIDVEHDDEPHLTDEEWDYVLAVNDTVALKKGEMVIPESVAREIRDGSTDG
jgi:hypothetical protein